MMENRLLVYAKKLKKRKTKTEVFFLEKLIEYFKKERKSKFPLIQTQVLIGWYIVDFLLPHKHLVIELDGNQHQSLGGRTDDIIRDGYLKEIGLDVLRFSNKDVFNRIEEILKYISLWASMEDPMRNY